MMRGFARTGVFALLLLLLIATAGSALAKQCDITASSRSVDPALTITARVVDNRHMLYIPGTWDPSAIRLDLGEDEALRIGDMTVESGQTVDLTPLLGGQKHKLYSAKGKSLGTLQIYHGSAIPSVFFTVDADEFQAIQKSKNNEIFSGHVLFVEANGRVSYDGGLTSFHGRGNSTFAYIKKPFQVKLESGADLCGMGKSKTWILLANYIDLSLLRNQITLDLCREIGLRFAVACEPVDVYVNGLYNGLYLLTEKIQIDKDRIDIENLEKATEKVNDAPVNTYPTFDEEPKGLLSLRGYAIPNDPSDITGGYILEMEKSYRYREKIDNGFKTGKSICITIKEPTCASHAQVSYIAQLFDAFHDALMESDGVNPTSGMSYSEYIDTASFARKYVIEEFSKNFDALASSQFFYKDSDSVDPLIYAGPCWDYDLSYGNIETGSFVNGSLPHKLYLSATHSKANLWWLLSKQDSFMAEVQQVYNTLLVPAAEVLLGQREAPAGSYIQSIDDYVAQIEQSAQMNFSRWNPANVSGYKKSSGKNFEQSVKGLKNFITKRIKFLSDEWAVK